MKGIVIILLCTINWCFAQQDTNRIEAWIQTSNELYSQGEFVEATALFDKIIDASKKDPTAIIEIFYNRAYAGIFINQHEQSRTDLNTVIKYQPNNAEAYFLRSKLQTSIKSRIEDLNKAYQLDQNNQKYIEKLALAKLTFIRSKLDELRNQEIEITYENLLKQYDFASGGCKLLQTLTINEEEKVSLIRKYCFDENIRSF